MRPEIRLPQELAEKLGITEVLETFTGGQKHVFIATRGNEQIALKWVHGSFPERDQREIEFYKKYKDAFGIPKIIEVIHEEGQLIVVEEYIPGKNLATCAKEYLGDDKKIGKLLNNICNIMDQFWDDDIVHRDLKPDNIIISDSGAPTVIDFGIHRNPANTTITCTDAQPHTVLYCSPEQLLPGKKEITYRSDFFSLGVIAYFLKYGVFPFGDTKEKILAVYEKGTLWCKTEQTCLLKKFFANVFHVPAANRPRSTKALLSGVPT